MSSRGGAPYVTLQKYSFTPKFGYLLFCNPTHEGAETANRWETTNNKPHGPIVTIGQSEVGISSQITFITLFSRRCKALLHLLPASANCANILGRPKPFSWGMGFSGFWAMTWSSPPPTSQWVFLLNNLKKISVSYHKWKNTQKTFMVIRWL